MIAKVMPKGNSFRNLITTIFEADSFVQIKQRSDFMYTSSLTDV